MPSLKGNIVDLINELNTKAFDESIRFKGKGAKYNNYKSTKSWRCVSNIYAKKKE